MLRHDDEYCCMYVLQEKLYVELKTILGRQPGPEVAEQLAVYQENLKQKVRASSRPADRRCGACSYFYCRTSRHSIIMYDIVFYIRAATAASPGQRTSSVDIAWIGRLYNDELVSAGVTASAVRLPSIDHLLSLLLVGT